MTWVITRLCRDCVDKSCVDVCPVECIYEYTGEDREAFPNQLYIQPDECIDCGACEPECPWEAIFEDSAVPDAFSDDIALNRSIVEAQADFEVPVGGEVEAPTSQQVEANKIKWGLGSAGG